MSYATEATVRSLGHLRGVNYLAFYWPTNSPSAETAVIAAIRGYLKSQTGAEPFVALPVTRADGDWKTGRDSTKWLLSST